MADRRVPFFLVSAAVCFLLMPVADVQFRWVAFATGVTYLVLAGLVAADGLSRPRATGGSGRPQSPDGAAPVRGRSSGEEGASW
jgi:hypothetical protein